MSSSTHHTIKPQRLRIGNTIGVIAPASAPPDPKTIDRCATALEKLGFKPLLARNVRKRWGFLAGSDRERAADLMGMFTNRKVDAIICVRGGYGTARLLPLLDFKSIRANPKIFIGYSDITSLHCAFLLKSNLVSFHGPMLNAELVEDDFPEFSVESLLRTLMHPVASGSIRSGLPFTQSRGSKKGSRKLSIPAPTIVRSGHATGKLIGGNLSILCTALGTPYQPSFKNKILFFEDLAEVPFRFDRMLTHLMNAGVLQQVSGVAVGVNKNCFDPNAKKAKEFRQSMDDVLRERLLPLKVPIVTGLPFGHIPMNATIPIGIKATLDAQKGDLIIIEPAVV